MTGKQLSFIGYISKQALRMRAETLMVRRASSRVSNHEATKICNDPSEPENALSLHHSAALAIRSGNAAANAARSAFSTPRSVIKPLTSRAGVTSKA